MTVYSAEIGAKICGDLAQGKTLTSICKDKSLPSAATVITWIQDPAHPMTAAYNQSRLVGYQIRADELHDIARSPATDPGSVNRDRLIMTA